jgi:hypothetical protein
MKVQLSHILQNMFQASSLDEVPVYKLEKIVREHPYFAPAHFLLAKKLQHDGNGEYEEQAQKAALYFHDPLWLHWQLNHGKSSDLIVEQPAPAEIAAEEKAADQVIAVEEPSPVEIVHEMEVEEPVVEVTGPVVEEEPVDEVMIPVETVETVEAIESFHQEEPVTEEPAVAELPKPAEPEPAATAKAGLPFDPYYTIDYFASQGIKAPQEVQPGDKLGMQLKSFTEWLRTMKRVPKPVAEEQSDEVEQQHIQRFAAGSLEGKEVVTETMAEVLAKQDRREEAIAIYEKLSLLDPSKKAFFAAKIENLKVN